MREILELIKLREYHLNDLNHNLELFLMNDIYPKITPQIKLQEKNWLKKVINNYKNNRPNFYVRAITLDNKLIGNLIAEKFDWKKNKVEIGFWIGRDYWKLGYTTKALELFLIEIIQKFNINQIYAHCKKKNIGSRKVLEKNGFILLTTKKGMNEYVKKV